MNIVPNPKLFEELRKPTRRWVLIVAALVIGFILGFATAVIHLGN